MKKRIHCEKLIRSFFVDLQKEIVSLIKWVHCLKHVFMYYSETFFLETTIFYIVLKFFLILFFFWHQMHGFKFGPLIFLPTAEEMGEKSLSVSIIISAMAFD